MRRRLRDSKLVAAALITVILIVIAMIVVPGFMPVDEREVQEMRLYSDHRTLSEQIDRYRSEHRGRGPHVAPQTLPEPRDQSLTPAEAEADNASDMLIKRMTHKTDEVGNVTPDGEFGPYIRQWPPNPFSHSTVATKIKFGTDDDSPRDGTTGWYYNTETCEISPNTTAVPL